MSREPIRDSVADLLADSGLADDGVLAHALESLRALCPPEAPEPSGALADLLQYGSEAVGAAAPSRAARRAAEAAAGKLSPRVAPAVPLPPRKLHRGAAISAAVIAGVGLSASGVAALGGVDYSANPPQAEVRSSAAAPAEADASVPGQASKSPDATVHQAQAFAAAASGGPVAHEEPAAPSRRASDNALAGDGAAASSHAVAPSAAVWRAERSGAARAAAAAADDALAGMRRDGAAVTATQGAPRHRADSAPSRGRHVAQEAAAVAQALVAAGAEPIKEAVALGQQVRTVAPSLAGLGSRH